MVAVLPLESAADGRQMLPSGWRPPAPFSVRVYYRDERRPPDTLWLMPYHRHPSGAQIYLAAGPAGQRIDESLVQAVDLGEVPKDAAVQLVTAQDASGLTVYTTLKQTLN